DAGAVAVGRALRAEADAVDALGALWANVTAFPAVVGVGVELAGLDALALAEHLPLRAGAFPEVAVAAVAAGDRVGAFAAGFGLAGAVRRFRGNAAAAEPGQRAGQDTAGERFQGCAAGMVGCPSLG